MRLYALTGCFGKYYFTKKNNIEEKRIEQILTETVIRLPIIQDNVKTISEEEIGSLNIGHCFTEKKIEKLANEYVEHSKIGKSVVAPEETEKLKKNYDPAEIIRSYLRLILKYEKNKKEQAFGISFPQILGLNYNGEKLKPFVNFSNIRHAFYLEHENTPSSRKKQVKIALNEEYITDTYDFLEFINLVQSSSFISALSL